MINSCVWLFFFSLCSHSHESAAAQQVGSQEDAGYQGSEGHWSTAHPETHHQLPLLPVRVSCSRSVLSAGRKKEWFTELLHRSQKYPTKVLLLVTDTVQSQAQSSHWFLVKAALSPQDLNINSYRCKYYIYLGVLSTWYKQITEKMNDSKNSWIPFTVNTIWIAAILSTLWTGLASCTGATLSKCQEPMLWWPDHLKSGMKIVKSYNFCFHLSNLFENVWTGIQLWPLKTWQRSDEQSITV